MSNETNDPGWKPVSPLFEKPRTMLEVGVEGDRFNPHPENSNCVASGCVPEQSEAIGPIVEGTWPEHCEQRAFVAGAKWWQFHNNGSTMFGSDCRKAEDEAIRRYGEPNAEA